MLQYPHIDPAIVSFGPIAIHWYGMMYLLAFLAAWWLGIYRAKNPIYEWKPEEVSDVIFYGALGVVLGGRIGYVLFYNFSYFLDDPITLFKVWQGGMSFHGGMVGVFVAMYLYGLKTGRTFFQVTDFIAPLVPFGLGAGRMGNFINGELWGRPTDLPWGMVFPFVDDLPRHPSMLYEAFLEGLLFFIILWWFSSKRRPLRAVSGLYLLCYGVFRFAVEFVREPDAHIGFVAFDWMTKGHLLSVPMLFCGILFLWQAYRKKSSSSTV